MAQHFLLTAACRDFSLADIEAMDEERVRTMFAELRWGTDGKQVCPDCGVLDKHYYVRVRGQWRCKHCGHTFSVTSGSIFADHKLPLKKLLQALFMYVVNVKGISASLMSRTLGIAYKTAFTLLHKLREVLILKRDETPLKGLAHVDGGHFSGRKRKPRCKPAKSKIPLRTKIPASAPTFHPNRRIIMVLREVSPEPGNGALRTIVSVAMSENQPDATALAKRFIEPDSVVMTDEHPAYSTYAAFFDHHTVNHSEEFSTDEGVNNNQAESFFTRARRFVLGQIHRITPMYLFDYANEMAWREDMRRKSTGTQLRTLLHMALNTQNSKWWCRYWQGHRRDTELLMA